MELPGKKKKLTKSFISEWNKREQEITRDKWENILKKELLNEYRHLIKYSSEGRNYFSNNPHTDRLEYELLKTLYRKTIFHILPKRSLFILENCYLHNNLFHFFLISSQNH